MSTFDSWNTELYHHGILGQKWGIRRFQNKDGTRTPAGEKQRDKNEKKNNNIKSLSDSELQQKIRRLKMEAEYKELSKSPLLKLGENFVNKVFEIKAKRIDERQADKDRVLKYKELQTKEKELQTKEKEAEASVKRAEAQVKQEEQRAKIAEHEENTYKTKAKRLETKTALNNSKIGLRKMSVVRQWLLNKIKGDDKKDKKNE